MEYLLLALIAIAIPFVLPIASWVYARRTRARLQALEAKVAEQEGAILHLETLLRQGTRPAAPSIPPPPVVQSPVAAPPPAAMPASVAPLPRGQTGVRPGSDQGQTGVRPGSDQGQTKGRPTASVPPSPPFDWESLVGVKLFSAVAGVALVLAAIFFLRYSIEHGWLQPPVRMAIGVAVAIALLVVCELKAARRYPATANAMDAAAIAILFATFFAAHSLWHLIPAAAAFLLLAGVTALAVLLSIRRESLFIAVLGLLGGFATPALLSSGENQPIPLFGYLVLLNVGLAWVAYRQGWAILTVLTLVLTTVYQWGWVFRFLDASQLTLAMGIFLVFPVIAMGALVVGTRSADDPRQVRTFEGASVLAAAMPLLFAVFLASVPGYGAHPWLLFGFLLLVDLGLFAIAVGLESEILHAGGAAGTLVVLATWIAQSFEPGAGVPWLVAAAVLALFYVAAPSIAAMVGRPFEGAALAASYAGPLALFVPAILASVEPAFVNPVGLFATTLGLVLVIAWRAVMERRGGLYFTAAFFAVAVQASWSAAHLTLESLTVAVTAYALFGATGIAVPLVARKVGRELMPRVGNGIVLLLSLGLLLFLSLGPVAPEALWALGLLLAILNAGLFIESAAGGLPLVAIVGSVGSWVVLGTWWFRAAAAVGVVPALRVTAALTLVTLAGYSWAHRRYRATAGTAFADGLFLAFGGHFFLLFVAIRPEWSLPPWSWMATLALLTLAVSTASTLTRRPALHAAGVVAASAVIAAWTATAAAGWATTAVLASFAVSAFALAWIAVARRQGTAAEQSSASAAAVVLFTGELTTILAVASHASPPFALVVAAHVLNLGLILALAWYRRWGGVAPLAVLPAAGGVLVQTGGAGQLATEWTKLLTLSFAVYAVFIAYPLVLRARTKSSRDPYVAAVLASALFFFAARAALEAGGYRPVIGALPIFEGGVLALLLRQLLASEPAGQRDMGRLALVGGAVLAFLTVAIPLQLRHQWITIGWALEAAALTWLYGRVRHDGVLATAAGLFAAVFVRLALNPEVFVYAPRGPMRILNWYLYAYAVCAAAFLYGSWQLARHPAPGGLGSALSRMLPAGGVILLFLLLNIEIADFYATGPAVVFRFGVTVSQDLTYTIGWLAFGMLLLGACIYLRSHAGRVAALALIAVTTFKCFLYDLGSLEGLYRVASFVGLATALALVSLALQKWVLVRPESSR